MLSTIRLCVNVIETGGFSDARRVYLAGHHRTPRYFCDTHLQLIHSWPLSRQSWSQQVVALVTAGHRPITYERRGFGRSDEPPTSYTYDALTDAPDLNGGTLAGFSMDGGEVARYRAKFGTDLPVQGSRISHSNDVNRALGEFLN